jgi:hypothetical protein
MWEHVSVVEMKQRSTCIPISLGIIWGLFLVLAAQAQDVPANHPIPAAQAAAEAKPGQSGEVAPAVKQVKHSEGVDEVLEMAKAGVSVEVLKTYIEHSSIAYNLSGADIIALKEHAVSDDVTSAMMKHGAALKAQSNQQKNVVVAAADNRRYVTFDPESYDYFEYYYLRPRALAAAQQRLYYPAGGPYGYGFRPFYGGAFARPW